MGVAPLTKQPRAGGLAGRALVVAGSSEAAGRAAGVGAEGAELGAAVVALTATRDGVGTG